ncbi:MAG: (deoxy)nucleoside triphosphate pyrophosphohydrolase [Deltaproteobacteria bacterium]|nr:(deoxy)nucleoside triphosphate pyrophosphohydrolase [Deltaproteobacteria bacterium]
MQSMEMSPLKKIHVVAGLISKDDCVLVCQRSAKGRFPLKWEFPGGKVELAEEPYAALSRELKEELGIEIDGANEMYSYNHVYAEIVEVQLRFFAVSGFRGEIANLAFEQITWAKFSELNSYDFLDGDLALVSKLASANGLVYQR